MECNAQSSPLDWSWSTPLDPVTNKPLGGPPSSPSYLGPAHLEKNYKKQKLPCAVLGMTELHKMT